jgi:2,3-dihydroxy-p-cumate/2,3-dihydroxybenzoate 3,4-dioxygenase
MRYAKLGYVALNVSDVKRSLGFYVGQVGLTITGDDSLGRVYLRCTDGDHDLVLCPGATPGLKRIGVAMQDEDALDELCAKLEGRALPVVEVDPAECRTSRQSRTMRTRDPCTGATLEFYVPSPAGGQRHAPTHTRIQRLGHVVLKAPQLEEASDFYTDVLELRVSDRIAGSACFLRFHPDPFHHGIGLVKGVVPMLHHVNFMVAEVDDIGKAIARFGRSGVPIVHGPGRHPASGSIFLYFLDPDGLTVEYSCGMEEFPLHGARPPRELEPVPASYDAWDSYVDPQRRAAVGAIEALQTTSTFE